MNLLNATGMAAHDAMGIHNTSAEKVVAATSASETECHVAEHRLHVHSRHKASIEKNEFYSVIAAGLHVAA